MTYMSSVLLFGMIWLFFYTRYSRLRSCSFLSGLFFLPAGFTQALFVPTYWNPNVMFKLFGLFDLESLFFAFFTGGIASVLYPVFFRCRIGAVPGATGRYFRHSFWLLPALAAAVIVGTALFTQLSLIRVAFALFSFGIIHMLIVRPDLREVCLWGALLFLVTYSGVAVITAMVVPQFVYSAWTAEPLFGLRILQIPVDEFVYAFLFGGLWSTVYCGIFDCRFIKPGHGWGNR